ncbi:winged helix-turn-helix transcriptional regulator [Sulfitobacter pseudonitzschiae]|mgnify:CR=1 FL=1|uniref:Winged helix-turn-helix transcriptional regulator n=1 Tax=Pseudosulfitobacter pseudonitzschiae TaxID=1402135 RepID=A0A9Q2NPH7_9RHOB|nr:MarR family winged helix-turn-helix transcriptional regulator [Pseudosulfitobacter pseudonitzschiae]MBM2291807.1 winged helix-turn-helix transcriptional regulator [Pseudosulfitobacter pseudonitzschiae]MBM2296725.1 winged helix-turn-helix transcriptional regulator [Pseudosulfitobacter pseudonitzschiae]MBM2301638.1 winged helix-turn-helix transcriptional regulator [Pseudosulfitobacter pseudonitzschiae]MBM2311421.1 winged helix-turn-helix transcriptional regulator [Pseudosulfitobacter pseudonit|tara:strand:+ start:2316 stop:2762 length:447 start_codon:yes stop_codon:yes gene_type:complete
MRDIMMLLHETAGLMRRRFEQAARPEELTLMQWRALGLLERNGPMRQVEIKEALEASPMTISDLAERMQSAGLVVRQTDPHDSRAKTLTLTEAGHAKYATMHQISEAVFEEVAVGISPETKDALRDGLSAIKINLGSATGLPEKDTRR